MGREMKFALIVGGSMVLAAVVFAVKTHHEVTSTRPSSTPLVPASSGVAQELDSLAQATQAPPPPAPDYSPTWISTETAADSSVRQGSTATLSEDVTSEDAAPGAPERGGPKPVRSSAPAYEPPAPASAPPSNTSPSSVNSTPSNNTELREYLRRGK